MSNFGHIFQEWIKVPIIWLIPIPIGMKTVVNSIIALTIIVPLMMTLSVQYPIFDWVHGPYNRCIGRFDTVFSPLDPDPITPGMMFNWVIQFLFH